MSVYNAGLADYYQAQAEMYYKILGFKYDEMTYEANTVDGTNYASMEDSFKN